MNQMNCCEVLAETASSVLPSGEIPNDSSLVHQMSESLLSSAAAASTSQCSGEVSNGSSNKLDKDILLVDYISWMDSEIQSTKCDRACLDVPPASLGGVVKKQLTFAKITQSWENLCSCGQNRRRDFRC